MMTSYLGSLAYKSWKLTKIMPNSLKLLNHYILSNAPQKIGQWALNLSLQTGHFHDDWKLADVHPRLKKPQAELIFSNLRPISNLSFVSKLVEQAVFSQTHDHLTAHALYPKAQSSSRRFHSTETSCKKHILLNMNQKRATLLVLLDLSAAFDNVRAPVAQFVEHWAVTREVVTSTPAGPTLRVFK